MLNDNYNYKLYIMYGLCIGYACRVDKNTYQHDRTDKNPYRHDRRADKNPYRHDRCADSQCHFGRLKLLPFQDLTRVHFSLFSENNGLLNICMLK